MRRNNRHLTAFFTVIALLFAQLAVAAYACPAGAPGPAAASSGVAAPCAQSDAQLANLCQKHCHGEEQSQSGSAPAVAFVAPLIALLEPATQALPIACIRPPALRHANSPPLTVRNCCFRI